MLALVSILYGVYFVIAGIEGNAPTAAHLLGQEGQFLYWVVVIFVLLALWESEAGEEIAKPFAVLIIIGFLLHKNNGKANYETIGSNAKALLPAL